jgi:lipoate-protein ligase B
MNICEVQLLGQVPYSTAWELQGVLAEKVAAGDQPPTLLLLEHPHTYTFGRRGQPQNLLWSEAEREARGVAVHWVDRGGDVTYHGPGQLVGYPILPLAPGGLLAGSENGKPRIPQADYTGYVRRLEKMLVKTLARTGIVSGQIPGWTGVWVQPDVASRCRHCPPAARQKPSKIAAIGVKVDARGISRHGFALNVETDPVYWDGIIGCGLEDTPVINIADLVYAKPDPQTVVRHLVQSFGEVFNYKMIASEPFTNT